MSLITKPTINKIEVEIRFSVENRGRRVFPAFSDHSKKWKKENFWYIIKKLKKLNLVKIDTSNQPYRYKVNEKKEKDSKYN